MVTAVNETITLPKTNKPFAFSYSRLKNFEVCGRRYHEVDILKNYKETSEALDWGDTVHKAAAARVSKGTPLPNGTEWHALEEWCTNLLTTPGKILVEQQLAITREFKPCEWFGKDVWFRIKCDVIKINGRVGLVIDWKTGKIVEDSVQLALAAACTFIHYPEVTHIRSEFIWLKENVSTPAYFKREDMPALWRSLWSRIELLEQAHQTDTFMPIPGKLCAKYCPVKTCVYNGQHH